MNRVFIIAEAGVNHNGDINIAKQLIDAASESGVDAVKFQTFKAEKLVTKTATKAEYQINNTQNEESQYEMIKKLEIDYDTHIELMNYCKEKNIKFMSTPFDLESIDDLNNLGLDIFKIPSGEITNYPYLKKISLLNKEIILSTGMATLDEVQDAINILSVNNNKISILHCTTDYPTNTEDVNLRAMNTMKAKFNLEVGYSDHTLGIEIPIAAVAMGACIIEKHFTLDKNMEGPDHKASLETYELKEMVRCIRNIEKAMGDGVKQPKDSEIKNKDIVRKSIVASRDIQNGEIFSEENIGTKRPGNGISPMRWNEIIGKKSDRYYQKDDMISL